MAMLVVQPGISSEAGQTVTKTCDRGFVGFVQDLERILWWRAIERIGVAGAPLIDQDDVALGLNATEDLSDVLGHLRGTLSRPSRREEERSDLESLPSPGSSTILRSIVRPWRVS